MNHYRKSYSVVAYTYRAETVCPTCVIEMLPTGEGEAFDGWAIAPGASMSTEDNLHELAAAFGIDIEDERSYDSGDFPKVVFADSVESPYDHCDRCAQEL